MGQWKSTIKDKSLFPYTCPLKELNIPVDISVGDVIVSVIEYLDAGKIVTDLDILIDDISLYNQKMDISIIDLKFITRESILTVDKFGPHEANRQMYANRDLCTYLMGRVLGDNQEVWHARRIVAVSTSMQ